MGIFGKQPQVMDNEGRIKLAVDILSSVLPTGAATAAHQVTQNTALQLIDNLVAALESVATDRLIVRGEDQLFSYAGQYFETVTSGQVAAGNHTLLGTQVPAGEVWVLTSMVSFNDVGPYTEGSVSVLKAAATMELAGAVTVVQWQRIAWSGMHPMVEDDRATAWFRGCALNDLLYAFFGGYKMTLET